MNIAEFLNVAATCVGFVSAIFFCIGGLSGTKQISVMSGTYWDFNKPLARSLAAQQAQYVVGALLLIASFVLQAGAILAGQATPQALPQWLPRGAGLFVAILLTITPFTWLGVRFLSTRITLKVLQTLEQQATK